jgi:FtsP/CotA-like multicopper oxidase with cupredoxin domain
MISPTTKKEEKKMEKNNFLITYILVAVFTLIGLGATPQNVNAQPVPGGTLDPLTIPKYVTPLVIPPVMNNTGAADNYDISVRQFQQQILPGGIWNTINGRADAFLPTTLWSYGPTADPTPSVAPDPASQFNYPAYTIETTSNTPVGVRWVNDLIDPATGNYLPHFLPVDQTLHWANPPAVGCRDGSSRTDCATNDDTFYTGPVPIVTHVHGAHVDSHSDGYPEAWWLPAANNIPTSYVTSGGLFDDSTGANAGNLGYADYLYRQDQPATTLWYHDHSLGMTRLNVYAGPAGFWLIRGGMYDGAVNGLTGQPAVLPGPAPVAGEPVLDLNIPGNPVRNKIREIPIVIQDRSFNTDGSLFYPDNRAFFEGLNLPPFEPYLDIPFVPNSDMAPYWNPEAFFNVMVVNGVSWPSMQVAPAKYRFRLLNGCNSRFLNLSISKFNPKNLKYNAELPIYQIGAEQGFLPQVAEIKTGFATLLPGNGTMPPRIKAASRQQALLMGLAERADIIVDFSGFANGTVFRMLNTAPDAPFGGFPDIPADPGTTGQVMQFVVNSALLQPTDALTTSPINLVLNAEDPLGAPPAVTRQVSLNEGESEQVCVYTDPAGNVIAIPGIPHDPLDPNVFINACAVAGGAPFTPKEALLGTVDLLNPLTPTGIPLKWTDNTGVSQPATVTMADGSTITVNVTENPTAGDTEVWEIYNFTADAHPIHLHLVRFEVVNREIWDPLVGIPGTVRPPEPWETGYKDTVIAYPGEITRVKALFDVPGLYVWHCHIVEHEDNEMMRPYVVSP